MFFKLNILLACTYIFLLLAFLGILKETPWALTYILHGHKNVVYYLEKIKAHDSLVTDDCTFPSILNKTWLDFYISNQSHQSNL